VVERVQAGNSDVATPLLYRQRHSRRDRRRQVRVADA